VGDSLGKRLYGLTRNIVWCVAYRRRVGGGSYLRNSRAIVFGSNVVMWGNAGERGAMRGWLIRAQAL